MSSGIASINDDPVAWVAAQPADPVRRRALHALALRAQAQPPGALRDKMLAALRRRASRQPLQARPEAGVAAATGQPLAALLALLQADAGHGLRQVQLHQGTWRRLRVARSIAQLDAPPAGSQGPLGPLNGQALATRVLQQIRLLAPDYLHRLLTQIDAIAAMEQVPMAGDTEKPARTRKAAERRR